jgi:archaeosine synthase
MNLFDPGRGHDGPARIGAVRIGGLTLETPLLTGHQEASAGILPYGVLGRFQPRRGSPPTSVHQISVDSPSLIAIPQITDTPPVSGQITNRMLLIPPSLLSLEQASQGGGDLLLEYQFEFLQNSDLVDPSRAVLRVPTSTESKAFQRWITQFGDLGVRAAAFVFDGGLGPSDLSSLALRTKLTADWVAVALGRIPPSLVPLLFYMGFDIFDTGHAVEAAEEGRRLWPMDSEILKPRSPSIGVQKRYRYCPCSACTRLRLKAEGHEEAVSLPSILEQHNLQVYRQVLSESLDALLSGRLRRLVESYTHSSPSHASLLRRVDRNLYSYLEEFTPTTGPVEIDLIGPESYNAPAVRRFREYVATRYIPPPGKKLVLLLPCSARKPYSDSKSHKRYLSVVESALGRNNSAISQAILTSPLGLVPRELERSYPASVYDIPVTGDWDHEEIQIGAEALKKHLDKFDDDAVIVAHVSGGYVEIVKTAEPGIRQSVIYTTPEDPPSRADSLRALEETLRDLRAHLDLREEASKHLREIVSATVDYQFGSGAGGLLLVPEAILRGKPYGMILCKVDGAQVCSYIGASGTVSLTLEGAEMIKPLRRYWVRLEAPRVKGGNVFAVGVQEADSRIRPGDEVIVLNASDEVVAVGKSEMSGREMCELARGRAVSIRHKMEE